MIKPVAAIAIAALAFAGPQSAPESTQPARVPFGVGEALEYNIRVAFASGSARLELVGIDTIKKRPAYHARFAMSGGIPMFRVNEKYNSWIDVNTLQTLEYHEDVQDSFYERRRRYEFFPETHRFTDGVDTAMTAERPVDQASIFYMIRTLDLRPGLDTSLNNYFLLDRNPIRIQVIGKERIKVPAGEFDAIVIHPVIKSKGLFAEGGDAKVWISDDDRRIVLQIKAKVPGLPKGTVSLYLKSYRPPTGTAPRNP